MKKIFPVACALFCLISCTRAGSLPPATVIEKAGQANQSLQSAIFTATTEFHGQTEMLAGTWDGTAIIAGTMANGGKQMRLGTNVSATNKLSETDSSHYQIGADLTIAGENEIYMRLNTLEITPPSTLFPPSVVTTLLNQWWLIPSGSGAQKTTATDISPDPALLRMQTQVITVTKDNGLVDIDDHTAYLYDITIDPVKMRAYLAEIYKSQGRTPNLQEMALSDMTAKGRIWIDESNFFIRRIVWDISSNDQTKPLQLRMDMSISKHNEPVVITIPQNPLPFPSLSR